MSFGSIAWFICIFVVAVPATDYNDNDITTESPPEEAMRDFEETLAVDLSALLDAGDGAVLTLEAGDTRLAVHRAVLEAGSPVLAAMLSNGSLEASSGVVSIPDVEGPVLRQLVAYLYTRRAPRLPHMAPQILAAADRYGVSGLKAACEQQVAAHLSVENVAAAALLALRHSSPSLRRAAVAFIKAHSYQVVMTQGWVDAVVGHPHYALELTRLIAEPPAGTSINTPASASAHHQPRSDRMPAAAAPVADPGHSTPLDEADVSHLQNLSSEEKGKRLLKAAMVGAVEELQVLLAVGADVGARDPAWCNWTALHWAADRGHLWVVRYLLEGGADAGATTIKRNTAIHLAAWSGHVPVVRHLLRSGVDPNTRGEENKTPLHFAAQWGNTNVVNVLLDTGADREAKDYSRRTPKETARYHLRHHLLQILTPR